MKIPSKLKVGGHIYTVVLNKDYDKNNTTEFGHHDARTNEIVLDASLPKDQLEVALLHEIFHTINCVLDHTVLDSLSEQLYQVLVDNKLLRD